MPQNVLGCYPPGHPPWYPTPWRPLPVLSVTTVTQIEFVRATILVPVLVFGVLSLFLWGQVEEHGSHWSRTHHPNHGAKEAVGVNAMFRECTKATDTTATEAIGNGEGENRYL